MLFFTQRKSEVLNLSIVEKTQRWNVETITVGIMAVNCYILRWRQSSEAFIIDPGEEAVKILEFVKKHDLNVKAIINTHGHGDHIGANTEVMQATGAPLWIGKRDDEMLMNADKNLSKALGLSILSPPADRLLVEGDRLTLGDGGILKVIETPGHSIGSISLIGEGIIIVGDVLFAGSIGRTDFPGCSLETLMTSIKGKIMTLPDDVLVFPGHGTSTTIGDERRGNPFLQPGVDLSMYT